MSRPPAACCALGVLVAATLFAGCGGGPDPAPARQAGPPALGGGLQRATCRDWRRASYRDRLQTVRQLEEIVAGPRREGKTLPRDRAYDILDGRCKAGFARGFLLYEIYVRAAAFS